MACAFCASGLNGCVRNLTSAEIIMQVYLFNAMIAPQQVSRVVVMGSGEPMLNYDEVTGALKFLHPINLAVSLHAVKDDVRTQLMPVNKGFPFPSVIAAAEKYARASGRQVTYEYILIKDKNDSPEDAQLLSNYLKFKHASVNLIPANPVPEKGFERPMAKRIEGFLRILQKNKINATIRKEMGKDINAACGQLRAKFNDNK